MTITETARAATVRPVPRGHAPSELQAPQAAKKDSTTRHPASPAAQLPGPPKAGPNFPADHDSGDAQREGVGGETNSDQAATNVAATSNGHASLADPTLALAADVLDDLETVRIANENRLRQLTRSTEDSDGELRGFGLTEADPAVARLAAIVELLAKAEADATKNIEKSVRTHPLGPWIKAQRGIGDKQGARLLAAIGDPYWNTLQDRPRTVSELWAYCGFHTIPVDGQSGPGTHSSRAVDGPNIAPKRTRGQKSNWSETARKRAWLVACSIVKSGGPYREVYDATKAKYADAVHAAPCVRCGPAGKPAAAGSPLSKAHIHARGLRAISKAVLRDLWREAKRLHENTLTEETTTT